MCTEKKNGNILEVCEEQGVDFGKVMELSAVDNRNFAIGQLFPDLMDFSDKDDRVELSDTQMAVLQGYYEGEKTATKANLAKYEWIPTVRIKPQDENGRDNPGYVWIRFYKRTPGAIVAAIYSAVPKAKPIYVEEFYASAVCKPKVIYVSPYIQAEEFLDGVRGQMRIFCLSIVSLLRSYPWLYERTVVKDKKAKVERELYRVRPIRHVKAYKRNERFVAGYLRLDK